VSSLDGCRWRASRRRLLTHLRAIQFLTTLDFEFSPLTHFGKSFPLASLKRYAIEPGET